ncbi:hypothetical protein GW535_10530 [Piscirickettsia salmonis]|nr:hypothetical protein GW535_10530 [Piscirickettsia salmonis]QIX57097.1 hypothetical protein GW536_13600 [Piscirickettsia salmonis]
MVFFNLLIVCQKLLIERYINTFMNVVGSTFFDFKTITSDNGTEFAGHEAISKITEADFYFVRPYRSCDRGLNEHTLRAMEC